MSGRFYLALAVIAALALAGSLLWASAILLQRLPAHPPAQFVAFLVPLLITMMAARPRDEGERLLQAAPLGLHPTNRRKALSSCFAPYRARTLGRALSRPGSRRMTAVGLPLALSTLVTGLIIPFACYLAFVLALRRAAWLGDVDAIMLECDWLRVSGPIRTERGRQIAAYARAS